MEPQPGWEWSTKHKQYYVLDSKGHRRYISNSTANSGDAGTSSSRQPLSSVTSGSPQSQGGLSSMAGLTTALGLASVSEGSRVRGSDRSPFQPRTPDFFRPGRVFATERQSNSGDWGSRATAILEIPAEEDLARFRGNGQIYVVVREHASDSNAHCYCLPVNTYGSLGVAREGVIKADHGIIYSGRHEVTAEADELPARGEEGMCAVAVKVTMRLPSERLHPMSRINYRTIHKFPKNLNVHHLGQVHKDSMAWLLGQFSAVQKRVRRSNAAGQDDGDEDDDEDNGGNGDDDENGENDDNDSRGDGRAKAPEGSSVRANQAKAAYHRLIALNNTPNQALASVAQILQKSRADWSWQDAVTEARSLLRSQPNPVQI